MLQIKKHLSVHSLSLPFALILLLFSSCAKDGDSLIEGKIFLTTENHLSPDKTSVSGVTVQWVADDKVHLCIGDYENDLDVIVSSPNAYVEGRTGKSGVIRAYYPNTILGDALDVTGAIDTPTVFIPSRYDSYYNKDGRQVLALPMAGRAESGATVVEFKHLTAALMVRLKNTTGHELTLDSVVASSSDYKLSGEMSLDLEAAEFGVSKEVGSGSVTVCFSGITLGTSESDIETVQIPIRPIGTGNLQIEVYAHCQGAAVGGGGVPEVPTTIIYHYNDSKPVDSLVRNEMMVAGIVVSNGGHTDTGTIDNTLFSVGNGKYVRFSEGNLRYTGSGYTFHTNQYDRVATQSDSDKDLFVWSVVDTWDTNASVAGTTGWRVLSSAEWNHLIFLRSGSRFAKACVNGVNGLIIFPDTYVHPISKELKNVNVNGSMNFSDNTFDSGQWSSMEAAGAVFLPAAGYYDGRTEQSSAGGHYWSSTKELMDNTKRLYFSAGEVTTTYEGPQSHGCSIRLAKTVAK